MPASYLTPDQVAREKERVESATRYNWCAARAPLGISPFALVPLYCQEGLDRSRSYREDEPLVLAWLAEQGLTPEVTVYRQMTPEECCMLGYRAGMQMWVTDSWVSEALAEKKGAAPVVSPKPATIAQAAAPAPSVARQTRACVTSGVTFVSNASEPATEAIFPITIFTPEQLFPLGLPSFGWKSECIGTSTPSTWEHLVRMLSADRVEVQDWKPFVYDDVDEKTAKDIAKAVRGGIALCGLTGGRRTAESFTSAQMLGLDIDGHGDVDHALEAFRRFNKIIVTSYNSTGTASRCRVFFVLKSRCADRDLFGRGHDGLRASLVKRGLYRDDDLDDAGRDPERLFYLPVHQPDEAYRVEVTDGEPLDLARLAERMPTRATATSAAAMLKRDNISKEDATAARVIHLEALRNAVAAMKTATEGDPVHGRHATARGQSYKLANLTPPIAAEDIAKCIVPYAPTRREHEFVSLVRSGLKKAGRIV